MREGPVEYLLVGTGGKLHESVLRTRARPLHLHLAMILLGFPEEIPSPEFIPGQRPPLLGKEIQISITSGPIEDVTTVPASRWVQKTEGSPLTEHPWIYNGSKLLAGAFLAEQEQSIIALMEDFGALANTSHPDRINDKIWRPATDLIPEAGVLVTLVLHLPK